MNIFYLHHNPRKCAKYHFDRHVVKMILESVQLLCSAIWMTGGEAPYKLSHKNHPSSIWARASKANWLWLQQLAFALCEEYTFRYGKTHKSEAIARSLTVPQDLPDIPFTPPTLAMYDWCKMDNTIQSYRRYYYFGKKPSLRRWKNRNPPKWFMKGEKIEEKYEKRDKVPKWFFSYLKYKENGYVKLKE